MDIRHDEIAVAQTRLAASAFRSPTNGGILAYDVIVTDEQIGFLAAEFKILRFAAYYGPCVDLVLPSDLRPPFDNTVGADFGAFADLDVFPR